MRIVKSAVVASALVFAASGAWAQDPGNMHGMAMKGMNMSGMKMDNMMGMHTMSATVTTVETKTGLVDVSTEGMNLKLHFPPASLANVKAGDNITLHLAFTKP
jgi:hypothetical protein